MWQFTLSGWRGGLRSRSFRGLLVLALVLLAFSFLAGEFSPRQPLTVALDVGLSGLRFALILMALFWVQDLVGREIDRRTINWGLAYPVGRGAYICGRFLAVVALLGLSVLLLGGILWLVVKFSGGGYPQSQPVDLGLAYWVTLIGLWIDVLVVAAFATLIASLSTVTILPLALGGAFAIAGRALGSVLDFLARGGDGQIVLAERFFPIVSRIAWVLPDLSRLDWRIWSMYGLPPGFEAVGLAMTMALAYMLTMLALAVWVFGRREFA